jgi:hypothetical protein
MVKIDIQVDVPVKTDPEDLVGNVYQVRGGRGSRLGHMHVIVGAYSYRECSFLVDGFATLTVDRDGNIVGANTYATHYFMDKVPIARCEGLEDIHLVMRSL